MLATKKPKVLTLRHKALYRMLKGDTSSAQGYTFFNLDLSQKGRSKPSHTAIIVPMLWRVEASKSEVGRKNVAQSIDRKLCRQSCQPWHLSGFRAAVTDRRTTRPLAK